MILGPLRCVFRRMTSESIYYVHISESRLGAAYRSEVSGLRLRVAPPGQVVRLPRG